MASLVPVKADNVSAVYDSCSRKLVLAAKGKIPGYLFTPFFKHEPWAGGLKFSIRAYAGGLGPQPDEKPFEAEYKFHVNLPLPHFNNASVLIETALGESEIEIKYTGLKPCPPKDKQNGSASITALLGGGRKGPEEGVVFRDVLTPIQEYLTGGADLRITAKIPETKEPARVSVEPSFNPTFFKLVDSSYDVDSISWTFQWNDIPEGKGHSPQLIDITRTTWNGFVGPEARTSIIQQGYVVHFVLLQK